MSEIELKEFSVKDNEVSLGGLGMGVQQVGGSGGIIEETDPTVPNWAKEPNKPTYDYSEIENTPNLEKIEEETELAKNKAEIALTTAENAEQNAKEYVENALLEYAKKTEVTQEISDLINSAPETLDTLGEIAKAIEDNAEVVDVLNQAIGEKASKTELQQVDQKTTNNATAIEEVNQKLNNDYVKNTELENKVDKVTGKTTYAQVYVKLPNGEQGMSNVSHLNKSSGFVPSYAPASSSAVGTTDNGGTFAVAMPQQPYQPTPKKYVDDAVANAGGKWYRHNIFVNIQNVTYYNMQIITTSQTAIEYNGNGLVIQGTVIGTMYYGAGGSTSNELQSVGILLPFAETYYPTIIVFGSSGLPEVKNFVMGSFFPSEVVEFIDTPTEL